MNEFNHYAPDHPPQYVKMPDGSFQRVMRPLIDDADAYLRLHIGIRCINNRIGHPNSKLVNFCCVECPDCGARYQQEYPINFEIIRA